MQALKRLDSNSDKWFKSEQDQMRRIHRIFRDSMRDDSESQQQHLHDLSFLPPPSASASAVSASSDAAPSAAPADGTTTTSTRNKADPEAYLPRDSCLRSAEGELARPLLSPFRDYDQFELTLGVEFWRPHFTADEAQDRMLTEIALSLVSHVCVAQAGKEMRVRHGSKPLGRYWRAKREQITPLALVMHELKLWATHKLRTMVVVEEQSHVEINKRIKYVQGLQRKEVWGPSSHAMQQGMRPIAHDKLFRLLLTLREDLLRARDFTFRGYCRRKSREKLGRLANLLRNLFLNETRIASLMGSFDSVVSEPGAAQLQPTDLFNQLHNQSFVDYQGNWVNLCLLKLCTVPLVKCALLAEFNDGDANEDVVQAIADWPERNLFFRRASRQLALDAETQSMPEVYCTNYVWLTEELRRLDKRTKQVPQKPSEWTQKMRTKIFALPSDALLVTETLMRYLAALQDLVPSMYAVHELWTVSGDGGDFTVYDTLRQTVVGMMGDVVKRAYTLQCAQRMVFDLFDNLSSAHQEAMESRRLKTKKAEYEPNWMANFRFVQSEFEPQSKRGFAETFKQAQEIARDAWDYTLTKQKLDDKVTRCRRLGDALTGASPSSPLAGDFSMGKVVDLKKRDWMGIVHQHDEGELGSSSSAGGAAGSAGAASAFLLDQDAQMRFSPLGDTTKFRLEAEKLDADENQIRIEFETRRVSMAMPTSSGGGSVLGQGGAGGGGGGGLGGMDADDDFDDEDDQQQHDNSNPFRE